MAKECCFDSQVTINSDEDDKLIDVLTFPTNFFLFSENSTQSMQNSESTNYPISSPEYKFMGKYYSAESQEQNNEIQSFKEQKSLQAHQSLGSQQNRYFGLESSPNNINDQNKQNIIEKKTNSENFNQRNYQDKQGNRAKDKYRLSLLPRSNKLNEKKTISNKINGILKGSSNRNSQIRSVGKPFNKNVSFQFTIEQVKTMRRNNKQNIFNMTNQKNTNLFFV